MIVAIDLATHAVIARVPAPHASEVVGITFDGGQVYVDTNKGEELRLDTKSNTLAPVSLLELKSVTSAGGRTYLVGPTKIVGLTPDGRPQDTLVYDGERAIDAAVVSPNGQWLYIATEDALLTVDTATREVVAETRDVVARNPLSDGHDVVGISPTPDGRRLFLTSRDSGWVQVVELGG